MFDPDIPDDGEQLQRQGVVVFKYLNLSHSELGRVIKLLCSLVEIQRFSDLVF